MRRVAVMVGVVAGLCVPSGVSAQEQAQAVAPTLVKEVKPPYPDDVRAARVEGIVLMECVVGEDGTVAEARVISPLHPDLDREALEALSQWRFLPGRKDGKPAAVQIQVEMAFALRDPEPSPRGPLLGSPDVYLPGGGVTLPTVARETKPSYPASAMSAGVQGRVKLECVVLPDGTVGDARVMDRLHPDIDAAAMRALRNWTFKPGAKEGAAVPVRVEVEMTFTTR